MAISFLLKLYRKRINLNIELLQKLKELSRKHKKHLVEIIEVGYDQSSGRYYEILEYIEWGTLAKVIKDMTPADEFFIDKIIEEIAEALNALHQENVVHRDLKPSNILVRDIKRLDLVLTDFGIARQIREDVSKIATTSFKGTTYYIAPEEISGYFGKEIDWWHLGIIVYELLKRKNPFAGLSEQVIIHTLVTKGIEIPSDIPEKYKLLLRGLLTRDYRKRWGYEQIKAWLRGRRDIPVYYEEGAYTEDEWSKYGFPGGSPWRTLGISPQEAESFRAAGFSAFQAKSWVEAGWRNGKGAKEWKSSGFDPEESLIFEQLGLSRMDARSIKKIDITAYDLLKIKEVIKNPKDLQGFFRDLFEILEQLQKKRGQAKKEKAERLIKLIREREYGFWYEKGFTLKEAYLWFHLGNLGIDCNEIKAWKDAGFEPFEAKAWKYAGFKPSEAKEWKNVGFEPLEAKEWKDKGFEPSEAKIWRDAGFSAQGAKRWNQLNKIISFIISLLVAVYYTEWAIKFFSLKPSIFNILIFGVAWAIAYDIIKSLIRTLIIFLK